MRCTLTLYVALSVVSSVAARVGFKKDQSTDMQFPPKMDKPVSGIPQGHLRPLGELLSGWVKPP